MSDFFYRPPDAWAADFIPFSEDGRFHLFYLLDWRSPPEHGEGTPWYRISTADFLQFTEHGEALPRGTRNSRTCTSSPAPSSKLMGSTTSSTPATTRTSAARRSPNKR